MTSPGREVRKPVTSQVTTTPGILSHAATRTDGTRTSTCGNATPGDNAGRNRHPSHRGGQGFKSPQLHRVLAGRVVCSSFWLLVGEPMWEPSRRIPVWLGLRAVARAKTASTSTTGATAGTAPCTRPVLGAGVGWSRLASTRTGSVCAGRSAARPRPRSRTSSRLCTRSSTLGCGRLRGNLPAEAAANKYRNYCWMKNPSQRVERNKRVKLAPVRLIVRRRDDNQ